MFKGLLNDREAGVSEDAENRFDTNREVDSERWQIGCVDSRRVADERIGRDILYVHLVVPVSWCI